MKKFGKLLGIIAIVAIIGFSMTACNEDGTFATLSGEVTISPSEAAIELGTELTANYSGSETVKTYEWKKDLGTVALSSSNKYKPEEKGTYTVTVNVTGYLPKTSQPVLIIDPLTPDLTGTITVTPTEPTTGTVITASYSGTEPVKFQWKKVSIGSSEIVSTSEKYTPTEVGTYAVTVSADNYKSKTLIVSVSTPTTPSLTGTISLSLSSGEITASYTGTENVTYQWIRGTTDVQGATSAKFKPTVSGFYSVRVSATGYRSKISDSLYITVTQ